MLKCRDYVLMVDCSLSMLIAEPPGAESRWQVIQAPILALASQCEQFAPDGLTLYLFSDRFERCDLIAARQIPKILRRKEPAGDADLTGILQQAFNDYFQRKALGKTQSNGATFLVITAAETRDRQAVMQVIIEASQQVDWEEELAISFIQVGNDAAVTQFLKQLDDELVSLGARFDIVDTVTLADLEDMTLTEVLINAIID